MLGQTLPGGPGSATVRLSLAGAVGTRAGLVVLGETYAWVGLELTEDGLRLVRRTGGASPLEEQLAEPEPAPATVELRVDWDAEARCGYAFRTGTGTGAWSWLDATFDAVPGRWIGAELGLFATAPPGTGPIGTAAFAGFSC